MENQSSSSNSPWWQPGLLLFFRLSGYIGIPVIIAVFIGKWLDKKYNTDPWLFLFSVGLAFPLYMIALVREAMKEFKKLEKSDSIDNKKSNSGKSSNSDTKNN